MSIPHSPQPAAGSLTAPKTGPGDTTDSAPTLPVPEALTRLLEKVAHPASLADAQERFLAVNSPFQRLFGYSPTEIRGLSPRILVPAFVPDEQLAGIRQRVVREGQPWHGTLTLLTRNGDTFESQLHLLPLRPEPDLPPAAYLSVWAPPHEALAALAGLGACLATALVTSPLPSPLPVSPRGTLRRDEVARLSALGFRNKEIARIMGIKASTVGVFKFQNRQRVQG